MRAINADKIKEEFPKRKSLNNTIDNQKTLTITEQIEDIKDDICDNYCKMPYKYSKNEWEELMEKDELPCNNCPLMKL